MTTLFSLTACQSLPGQPGEPTLEEISANPFVQQYDYSEGQIISLTENDTLDVVAMAGPLYLGRSDYPHQPALKKFREMKAVLVGEIISAVSQLEADAESYSAGLKTLKDQYVDFLGATLEQNNKLARQMKDLAKDVVVSEVRYVSDFAQFRSIVPDLAADEAVKAHLQYQQVYLALDGVAALTEDTAQTVNGLLALEKALETSDSLEMQAIGGKIESAVADSVDELGEKLVALQEEALQINFLLKRIETAEYYLGLASVQYLEEELSALKPLLAGMETNGELLAQEDLDFIKELAGSYELMIGEMKEALGGIDQNSLLVAVRTREGGEFRLVPVAYAQEKGYLESTKDMFVFIGQATGEGLSDLGKFTWETTKSTYNAATTVAGVTLDTLAAGTKSGADIIYGVANGNSAGEIGDSIKDNFKKIKDNYDAGASGSEILRTGREYFEGAEKVGGEVSEAAVEQVMGKGWTSWMAGHAGRLTVNIFTSFGKGVTRVADKKATAGEIAEGALDIGMSFIGGSKAIMSGSQVFKGSKESLKLAGKKGINYLGKILHGGDLKKLKGITAELLSKTKLTPSEVTKLLSNSLSVEIKEMIMEELKATGKRLNKEILDLLAKSGKTILSNATSGARQAFKDFVREGFENSLNGVKDAIVAALGKSVGGYIDNLLATATDDMIKAIVKDYIDKGKIPGVSVAPDLKDLAGTWSAGSMTVTEVEISEAFRKQAEAEGCDLSEVENQKGKKQEMSLTLNPKTETAGEVILKFADGDAQTFPFTYEDGVIKGEMNEKEAKLSVDMNVSEEDGKYRTEGGLNIDYGNGGVKIKAETSAEKAKPAPAAPVTAAPATEPANASDTAVLP